MKEISIGTIISDGKREYTITDYIGSGGFAVVYKAVSDDTAYAVKVIRDDDARYVYGIKNEFNIASRVNSNHAIKYYHLNEHGQYGFPCFIIMEYADGGSLNEELLNRISIGKPYSMQELKDIYFQLVDGMIDISKTAVHRDIKPQNILIAGETYKVSDYGISKFAGEETRSASKTMKGMGSLLYYAPELWADPTAHGLNDTMVDIYAMGIVFYQLANLAYPYDIISDHREMHMISAVKPFNRAVDPVFQLMIKKMLEKPTADRFDSWEKIKEFLVNSSIGRGEKRDPFVDSLLKDKVSKQQAIYDKTSKEQKAKKEKEDAFKRLVSQIESKIYMPLKEMVGNYNQDAGDAKIQLSKLEVDVDNETCSFEYEEDPLSKDGESRAITFSFETLQTEISNNNNMAVMPVMSYKGYDQNFGAIPDFTPSIIEYKYYKNKIILWGTIKADCGAGISVGILEDPADSMYGIIKSFIRIPLYEGQKWHFSISTEKLKKLCCNGFRETQYEIKVENFNFDEIKVLIKYNQFFSIGQIKDPFGYNVVNTDF